MGDKCVSRWWKAPPVIIAIFVLFGNFSSEPDTERDMTLVWIFRFLEITIILDFWIANLKLTRYVYLLMATAVAVALIFVMQEKNVPWSYGSGFVLLALAPYLCVLSCSFPRPRKPEEGVRGKSGQV